MKAFEDLPRMPGTGEGAAALFDRAEPPAAPEAAAYLQRRAIPAEVALEADVRFAPRFDGRPAVLVAMRGARGELRAVHGRYLHNRRGEPQMLTVGRPGGVVSALGGWRADPVVLVEGLFDALSLATCGRAAAATVGRWAEWLPAACAGRDVWIAFDGNRPGEEAAERAADRLVDARVRRLRPPPRCQDWNTALRKRGRAELVRWLARWLGDRTGP